MKRFLSRFGVFNLISWISLFVIFLYLEYSAFPIGLSLPSKIICAGADSSLFFFVISFFKGRWRWAGGVVIFLLAVIVFANVIYLRTFHDLIPPSAYFNSQLSDPTVINGTRQAFRSSDLILIIAGLAPLIFCFSRSESPRDYLATKVAAVVTIMAWTCSLLASYRRDSNHSGAASIKSVINNILLDELLDWKSTYLTLNFPGYVGTCLIDLCRPRYINLSEGDIRDIGRYLAKKADPNGLTKDSLPKNLILILVESLESEVLKVSENVHPTLSRLIADSTSVFTYNCKVDAGYGRSSDAQFILNTGLLPLRQSALVTRFASNDYPSLVKSITSDVGSSVELIGEDRELWNHSVTTRSYGYQDMISNIAPETMNQDSLIFAASARRLDTLREPYCMLITSLSMHDPYTSHIVSSEIKCMTDERDNEYMSRLNHFDRALNGFLEVLKEKGMYYNTLIVITGDHEILRGATTFDSPDFYVPLLILNSRQKGIRSSEISQIDIFPTILYLMGKKARYLDQPYTGLGTNIFSPESEKSITDKDYEVSEKIIRGRRK